MFSYEENEKIVNKAIRKCICESLGNEMKEELTIKLISKLVILKNKYDALKIKNERNDETKLTFKVMASNELEVRVYPYFDAPIAIVNLNYLTEGQCESVIQKVNDLLAKG